MIDKQHKVISVWIRKKLVKKPVVIKKSEIGFVEFMIKGDWHPQKVRVQVEPYYLFE